MEVSDKENLRRLGEKQDRVRRAFAAGFLRGASIVGVFCEHKMKETENEEGDFYAGQIFGAIVISVALACVVIFLVHGGG
jgi:hypothetical protein